MFAPPAGVDDEEEDGEDDEGDDGAEEDYVARAVAVGDAGGVAEVPGRVEDGG